MIPIVYEDDNILVVDKPSGLAVQPGAGIKRCLVDELKEQLGYRPFLVHRLDRDTSGLLIVARRSRDASRWTELVAGRAVEKRYLALTVGCPGRLSGIFEEPVDVKGRSLPAETAWRLERRFDCPDGSYAAIELVLRSGRMHQIRKHLAQTGTPVVGDDEHGDFARNREAKKLYGAKRLMLLSRDLVLPGGKELHASLPEHMAAFIAALELASSDGAQAEDASGGASSGAPGASP